MYTGPVSGQPAVCEVKAGRGVSAEYSISAAARLGPASQQIPAEYYIPAAGSGLQRRRRVGVGAEAMFGMRLTEWFYELVGDKPGVSARGQCRPAEWTAELSTVRRGKLKLNLVTHASTVLDMPRDIIRYRWRPVKEQCQIDTKIAGVI